MHTACTLHAHRMHDARCRAHRTPHARVLPNKASRSPRGVRQSIPWRRLHPPCSPPAKPRLAQRTAGAAVTMPRQELPTRRPRPQALWPRAVRLLHGPLRRRPRLGRACAALLGPRAGLASGGASLLPCIPTHFGWLASASWHMHRHCRRICACVCACDSTVAGPPAI